jgi:uncharacterized membrane protein
MVKKLWQQHSYIILILVLALGLRLPHLNGSFWLDEAAQALESSRPWSQQLDLAQDFQPPLIHLLLFLSIKISTAEWWLRSIGALIPGLITIWASYEIGRQLISKKSAIIATLLLATSSFHIFYSQELRPYSLPAMWATISWLFLIKATRVKKFSRKHWLGFIITSILGLYSSYLYPFLWFSQLVWLIWQHKDHWRETLTSSFLTIISFLPWMPFFLEQLKVGKSVQQELPGWENVVSISQLKSPALVVGKFVYGVVNIELNWFFISSFIFLISLIFYLVRSDLKKFKQKQRERTLKLLISWLIIPSASAWLVSFFVPIIRPKRVLFLLPAVYLTVSLIATVAKKRNRKHWGTILISCFLALNVFGVLQYHLNSNYQRENWRALHQEISDSYPTSETIMLFSYRGPFSPWKWYDQNNYQTLSTGELFIENASHLSDKIKALSEYRYVLLFDYLRDLTDPDDQLRTELWSLGFHEINTIDYPNIGFVRVFSRYKPTAQL